MARKRTRKYQVCLSDEQSLHVNNVIRGRKVSNTIIDRGRVLLLLDENHGERYSYKQVADITGICLATVANISRLYPEQGLAGVMQFKRNKNSDNAKRKCDGRAEAAIIKMACEPVPEGHARWILRLLEKKSRVILEVPVSNDTIARTLRKTGFDLTATHTGAFRAKKTRKL